MKKFTVDLHGTLEAENLDDAFMRLGIYFVALGMDEDTESPFDSPTEVRITPR